MYMQCKLHIGLYIHMVHMLVRTYCMCTSHEYVVRANTEYVGEVFYHLLHLHPTLILQLGILSTIQLCIYEINRI